MKIEDRKKNLQRLFRTALVFFVVTVPFRSMFALTEVTEVRPAGALPPVFGLLFGGYGALGCAIGNLAADILSGYPAKICVGGFFAQLLYGLLPCMVWRRNKRDKTEAYFQDVSHVLKYIAIVTADSMLMAVMLGSLQQFLGIGRLLSQATLLLFLNNLVFCLMLGIPILILAELAVGQSKQQVLTLNVRFILIFLFISVVSALFVGITLYQVWYGASKDVLELWNHIYMLVSLDFFVMCGLSVCFLAYLEKNITVPIERLAQIAGSYVGRKVLKTEEILAACGELAGLHGEPGDLAVAFGRMVQDVEHYIGDITQITAEKERIRTELEVASHMQADMLPDSRHTLAERREFVLRARMTPAKEVGGDFYDFFLLDEDHLVFLVADVSGKGVPAALFMVISKTLLRNYARGAASAETVFTEANDALCMDNKNGMFVTAWMGVLTLSTGKLMYVNAGHTRPLLRRKDGSFTYLTGRSGFVLAGMEHISYRQEEIQLHPGDTIFTYTDGVTEANDVKGRLYGEERLKEAVNRQPESSPDEILKAVWDDVMEFQGEAEQFDDITMLALCYNGNIWETKKIPADMRHIEEARKFVAGELDQTGLSKNAAVAVFVAFDEIYSNICYYSGATEITIGVSAEKEKITLYFEDDGTPFNPLARAEPEVKEPLESRRTGGLGIYLVKKQMDEVHYCYIYGKNRITIVKQEK